MLNIQNLNINTLNDAMQNYSDRFIASHQTDSQWNVFRESNRHVRIIVFLPGTFNNSGDITSSHSNDIVNLTNGTHGSVKISDDYSEADVSHNHHTECVHPKGYRELADIVTKHIYNMVTEQEHKYPKSVLKTL